MARAKSIGPLETPRHVYDLIREDISKYDEEHLMVICVDFRGQLRDWFTVAIGQRHKVAGDISDIMRNILASGCDWALLAHNHPSGHPQPSKADGELTENVRRAMKAACPEILFADHLVVSPSGYYSFTSKKLFKVN
jgi:DNA repair protein RadC